MKTYNIRVESKREDNGSAITYTFRKECETDSEAWKYGLNAAIENDMSFGGGKKVTDKYSIWFVSDEQRAEESHQYALEKAMAEYYAGGYDESIRD